MHYLSTRGQAPPLDFENVLLAGLASDGGLYLPEHWPPPEAIAPQGWQALAGKPYPELAAAVMQPFVGDTLTPDELRSLCEKAYATFRHHAVAPLVQLGPDLWLMELYHGPTLAFKDVAMQVLGLLYDRVLSRRDERITVVGATSGDTGSAAIEAVRRCDRATIFILHPHGRTSEVQRRQMTTLSAEEAPNVHNLAIEGTFDDCQALVKAMFGDPDFREAVHLSGVNSINWARVLPQAVYYVAATLALAPHTDAGLRGEQRPVHFSVPTGNFGDVFAGWVAKKIRANVGRLIVASNSNDILTRAIGHGDHTLGEVVPTMSPSMDIQVSSNFERLLFEAHDRDPAATAKLMHELQQHHRFAIADEPLQRIRDEFSAYRVDEEQTLATIRRVHETTGLLIDPHTAVGVDAAERARVEESVDGPLVVLGTAHPAKFPDAIRKAVGVHPPLPPHLADLYERDERFDVLPNDLNAVQLYIRERAKV